MSATIVAPRQNLKTGLLKQKALGDLYLMEEEYVVWSAHKFDTARRAFLELKTLIEGSEYLARRTDRIYEGTGTEAIVTTTGGRLEFKARTHTGSRGLAVPNVFMDEAFSLQSPAMASLLPLILAQPDPHVVYASTAGLVESDFLRSQRDRGRAGDPTMTYLEWCDDLPGECEQPECSHMWGLVEGCRLDDPARWHRAMPALGGRVTIEAVRLLRRDLTPEDFGREVLGYWYEPAGVAASLSYGDWVRLEDRESQPASGIVFGIDVTPDHAWSSLALCGRRKDAVMHVDVDDVDGHRRGTGWVVDRCADLVKRYKGAVFAIDGTGPPASLIPAAQDAGLQLMVMATRDVMKACGLFVDAVAEGTLRHRGQRLLNTAVAGARPRPLGDGGFAFGRAKSDGDISPLNAAAFAHWAAVTNGYDLLSSVR